MSTLLEEVISAHGGRERWRRVVYPRLGHRERIVPFPLLVWIEIDDLDVRLTPES